MRRNELMSRVHTFGWIDTMSSAQIAQAFEAWPKDSFPSGWDVPIMVTALLIGTDNIEIAPGLSATKTTTDGPIGLATKAMIETGVSPRPPFSESARSSAVGKAKRRVSRNFVTLKAQYERFREQNGEDIHGWMDWSIRLAWVEHAEIFGGLLDREFIPHLSRILGTTEKELLDIQKNSGNPDVVRDFVKRQPDTDAYKMTYECYFLAALLRGLYHDYLAKDSGQQVAHHPFRTVLLPQTRAHALACNPASIQIYLAQLVLHSALLEKNLEFRLLRWADNIKRIRNLIRKGFERIDMRPKEDSALEIKEAVRAARLAEIKFHRQGFEDFINLTTVLTVGSMGFFLNPFFSLIVGAIIHDLSLSPKGNVGKCVAKHIYSQPSRLSELVKYPPGRISAVRK